MASQANLVGELQWPSAVLQSLRLKAAIDLQQNEGTPFQEPYDEGLVPCPSIETDPYYPAPSTTENAFCTPDEDDTMLLLGLSRRLENEMRRHNETRAALRTEQDQVNNLEEEVRKLHQDNAQWQSACETVYNTLGEHRQEKAECKEENTALRQEKASLTEENVALKQEIYNLKVENKRLQTAVSHFVVPTTIDRWFPRADSNISSHDVVQKEAASDEWDLVQELEQHLTNCVEST